MTGGVKPSQLVMHLMLYFCKQINKHPKSCYSALRETGHLNLDIIR